MRIGKYRIIKEEKYQDLRSASKLWRERRAIIEDNNIQKQKEKLERKYKKWFGKYFESEEGIVFKIEGIYYDRYSYGYHNQFKFSTSAPNFPEWDYDVDIDDIIEGVIKEVKNPIFK